MTIKSNIHQCYVSHVLNEQGSSFRCETEAKTEPLSYVHMNPGEITHELLAYRKL